jgi:hypothetical protein
MAAFNPSFANIHTSEQHNDVPLYPPYNGSTYRREELPETLDRSIGRTPSPTPSEQEYLGRDTMVDNKAMFRKEYWQKRKNIGKCLILCTP